MRGIGNHTPPLQTQPAPMGNSSFSIDSQVRIFGMTNTLIHAESAREIAAWWQSSGNYLGQAFAAFASTGTIETNVLSSAIEYELSKPGVDQLGADQALKALQAYIAACN